MKHLSSHGVRFGIAALAAQLLMTVCLPAAMAQDGVPRRGEPITLNFSNAEIESVARTMAVITGRDVVVDPRVKGVINLQTERAIAPAAAFNQFAAALRLQGFAVVQADGLYKIVPEADAKLQSSAVTTSTGGIAAMSGNQIVTQVFKLNYESANNLLPVLRPLIAPNNTINVNPGNNSLVITDYAENMRRLARIVASLDVPNASDIEVIPLKHSIASDMVTMVNRLLDGGPATAGGVGGAAGGVSIPGGAPDSSFRTSLLADPRSNSLILRAANPARAQLVRSLIAKLDRAAMESPNGEAGNIYVVYLKNADAVKLATTLRAAMASDSRGAAALAGGGAAAGGLQALPQQQQSQQAQGGALTSAAATAPLNNANPISTGGQIQADPTTNSLIITASEPQYRQLRAVIDRLDGRRAQVMIESLIVEVNATKAAEFGVQWQSALGGGNTRGVVGTNSSVSGAGNNIINLALGIAAGTATTLPSSGLNLGIGRRNSDGQYTLGALARFLASDAEGNVLSTPQLLTLDNEEAKIVIGQNVPFPTGQYASTNGSTSSVNPFTTVERKDVGLTLRVRPQINENGTIKMQIFQEVSNVDPATRTDANGPTTNKRSIESSVLVEDGSIVMLGGLLQDDYSGNQEKVPGLGDVPLFGNLFKNEIRKRIKTNLMVFIRPVVLRDGGVTEAFASDRYEMIRGIQQTSQPQDRPPLNTVSQAPILPPLVLPESPPDASRPTERIEGTRLIPPPAAQSSGVRGTGGINRTETLPLIGPQRGALPPTSDPLSSREPN